MWRRLGFAAHAAARGGGRESCFDGEGKGAAVRTSGRLLWRRRGAGEAGEAGDGGRGRGPPESPLGATRGRVQNSQYDGPVGGWGSNDYFTLDLFG